MAKYRDTVTLHTLSVLHIPSMSSSGQTCKISPGFDHSVEPGTADMVHDYGRGDWQCSASYSISLPSLSYDNQSGHEQTHGAEREGSLV